MLSSINDYDDKAAKVRSIEKRKKERQKERKTERKKDRKKERQKEMSRKEKREISFFISFNNVNMKKGQQRRGEREDACGDDICQRTSEEEGKKI